MINIYRFTKYSVCSLDILLQQIWLNHKRSGITLPYPNYVALVEAVNRTPRIWNTNHDLVSTLKYI
jgi:hypothetical protein